MLASKSNYQNILDGTHVPGVTYPEALSTNLTSKRTSHKIAEQGRRNRINMALQEMQSLLPQPASPRSTSKGDAKGSEAGEAGENDKDSGKGDAKGVKSPDVGAQGNSKAATVESAIEFIKLLKREASEKDKILETKDRELENLRRKLRDMETRLGGSSKADTNGKEAEDAEGVNGKADEKSLSKVVEENREAHSPERMDTDTELQSDKQHKPAVSTGAS